MKFEAFKFYIKSPSDVLQNFCFGKLDLQNIRKQIHQVVAKKYTMSVGYNIINIILGFCQELYTVYNS